MPKININVHTDSELESKAQEIFDDLGLDMSTAINIFLKEVVHKEAIPFEVSKSKTSNAKKARSLMRGCLKGKVWMADDFDAPLDEMQEYM